MSLHLTGVLRNPLGLNSNYYYLTGHDHAFGGERIYCKKAGTPDLSNTESCRVKRILSLTLIRRSKSRRNQLLRDSLLAGIILTGNIPWRPSRSLTAWREGASTNPLTFLPSLENA